MTRVSANRRAKLIIREGKIKLPLRVAFAETPAPPNWRLDFGGAYAAALGLPQKIRELASFAVPKKDRWSVRPKDSEANE